MSLFMVLHDTAAGWVGPDDNGEMVVETLDLTDAVVATQVLSVQRAAYQIEADLIGSDEIPPLHEDLAGLMAAPLLWLGIRADDEVVAAMAFTVEGRDIDIDRLVVDPGSMRCGYGSALVAALVPNSRITASTGTKNLPAHRFYLRHGFGPVGQSEPIPGLSVTHFERRPQ
jgi:GNAT superfamily N-acetyltransferase